jgi:hypothetical protein
VWNKINQIAALLVGILLVWGFVSPETLEKFIGGLALFGKANEDALADSVARAILLSPFALCTLIAIWALGIFLQDTGWLGVVALTAIVLAVWLASEDFLSRFFATIAYLADLPIVLRSGKRLDRAVKDFTSRAE